MNIMQNKSLLYGGGAVAAILAYLYLTSGSSASDSGDGSGYVTPTTVYGAAPAGTASTSVGGTDISAALSQYSQGEKDVALAQLTSNEKIANTGLLTSAFSQLMTTLKATKGLASISANVAGQAITINETTQANLQKRLTNANAAATAAATKSAATIRALQAKVAALTPKPKK